MRKRLICVLPPQSRISSTQQNAHKRTSIENSQCQVIAANLMLSLHLRLHIQILNTATKYSQVGHISYYWLSTMMWCKYSHISNHWLSTMMWCKYSQLGHISYHWLSTMMWCKYSQLGHKSYHWQSTMMWCKYSQLRYIFLPLHNIGHEWRG